MIYLDVQIHETAYPKKPTTVQAGEIKRDLLRDYSTLHSEASLKAIYEEAMLKNKTVAPGICAAKDQDELAYLSDQNINGTSESTFKGYQRLFMIDIDNDTKKYRDKNHLGPEDPVPPIHTPQSVKKKLAEYGIGTNIAYETSSSVRWKDEDGKEYPSRFRVGIVSDKPATTAQEVKSILTALTLLFDYADRKTVTCATIFYGTNKGPKARIDELNDFEHTTPLAKLHELASIDTVSPDTERVRPSKGEFYDLFRENEKKIRNGEKPEIKEGYRDDYLVEYAFDCLNFFDEDEQDKAKFDYYYMASHCVPPFKDVDYKWQRAVRDAPKKIYNRPDRFTRKLMDGFMSKIESRLIPYKPDQPAQNKTPQDPETIAQAREKRLQELKAKTPYASKTVDAFKDEISDDNFYYVDTGFARLNDILGGGIYTGLHMVGAETGLGKTTLALQIADHISSMGHDVIFIEMEMTRSQLMARSISRLSYLFSWFDDSIAFEAQEILNPDAEIKQASNFTASFDTALEDYRNRVGKCLRFCCELGSTTTDDIRLLVEDHINGFTPEDGEPRKEHRPVLIVDYLQILNSLADLSMNDKQKIDLSINDLKLISNEFHIPILSISSLNRGAYGEPAGLSALKETGSIEYTADTVWIIQIDGADPKGNESKEKRSKRIFKLNETVNQLAEDGQPVWVEIKVLKNRFGKKGKVPLDYLARYNYFSAGDYSERAKIRAEADAKEASQKIKARDRALAQSALETDKKIEASKEASNKPFNPYENLNKARR